MRRAAALTLAILCAAPSALAQDDPIAGTWELTSYEDPGNRGRATGLLFLRDGRKGIVGRKGLVARPRFRMEPNELVVTYENGSVQRFRRASADRRSGKERVQ